MQDWTDFKNCIKQIVVDNDQNLSREPSIFEKVQMPWEINFQTLFQFKEIYTHRLDTLRKAFDLKHIKTIENLSNSERVGELIGLFKRIEDKRVRAFEPEYLEKYENHKPVYSEKDTYELEDSTGKVKLQFKNTKINGATNFSPIETPYGVIIKCKGEYIPRINRFRISNIQTPKPAPQSELKAFKDDTKYMYVMCEPTIDSITQMRDYIKSSHTQEALKFNELVIINGISYQDGSQIRQLDELLFELGAFINIFIVPSSNEEKSFIFPQNPMHKSILQKCYIKNNTTNCSNPQILRSRDSNHELNTFISCGQNLMNLKANCRIGDELQLMKLIIEYRHVCPSSVFSLPIRSYNYDPLILSQTPHLMIHGKCQMYNTEAYERETQNGTVFTRLVALAKGDAAQIDLSSVHLTTKKFNLEFFKTNGNN